jgi:hypothetical protein
MPILPSIHGDENNFEKMRKCNPLNLAEFLRPHIAVALFGGARASAGRERNAFANRCNCANCLFSFGDSFIAHIVFNTAPHPFQNQGTKFTATE